MKKSKKEAESTASEPATKEEINEVESINPQKKSHKGLIALLILIILIPALGIGGLFGYQSLYQGKIYEGVYVGPYSVGGMTRGQVAQLFENVNKKYQEEGIVLNVTTASGTMEKIPFKMKVNTGENQLEIAHFDSKKLADYAFSIGRSADKIGAFREMIIAYVNKPIITPDHSSVNFNEEVFNDVARELLAAYENPSQNAGITVSSLSPFAYETTPEKTGSNFDYEVLSAHLKERLHTTSFSPISIAPQPSVPTITESSVTAAAPTIPGLLSGPISIIYEDATSSAFQKWKLSPEQLSKWLVPVETSSNSVSFGADGKLVKEYLEANISKYINRQSRDAKFRMEGDKVVEFQGSQTGLSIDYIKTIEHLNQTLSLRSQGTPATSTQIVVVTVPPSKSVADVNSLGITDIVGIGVSTFHDSHTNRIKNIARAVKILNGTLIKPGETFSTLDHTAPFTTANGYLPELVIKGAKIVPELGGGLCQISTTLFRTAMNSALPITERSPHALVVNYYADPTNGNPGVDATIYEGSVDFKFKNDTDNYLLLQTDIDYTKQQLTFTLWGKPDGRKGSYTPPIILSRTGAGAPQEIPDPELAPGKRRCQGAFTGATASFTYTRILPSGEQVDRVFQSTYRSQPAICYVGVEKGSEIPLSDNGLIVEAPVVDELAPVN